MKPVSRHIYGHSRKSKRHLRHFIKHCFRINYILPHFGFPFCAKRKINLRQTIFRSQPNDFSFSAERKKAFCNPYTLSRYPEKRSLKKGMASHEAIPFKFLKKYPPSTPTKRISVSASARFNLPATDNANWRPSSVPALHGGIWQTPIWPSASPATNNCRSRAGLLRELPLHIPQ